MSLTRRYALSLVAAGLVTPTIARAQGTPQPAATPAQTTAWKSERSVGSPTAKITVDEWFSLTCIHCAHFAQETFPQVTGDLVKTGKVRWVFRDFPLDRIALQAAMVARALPPDRYENFILALFSSQDRWAFAQGVDYTKELWDMAALAGMNRATFDTATTDNALQDWILAQQADAQKKYGIDATPSFVINGKMYSGEMSYADFVKLLPDVS
jgi:protein-disulfide isomerase